MNTTLADEVDFSIIRYAQCREDADVVLEALHVMPGDVCVSIASAGDNTLSLLARDPAKVVAVDLSESQLACLDLRVEAYRRLTHGARLELLGARPSTRTRVDQRATASRLMSGSSLNRPALSSAMERARGTVHEEVRPDPPPRQAGKQQRMGSEEDPEGIHHGFGAR